jgi:hypothetical protein
VGDVEIVGESAWRNMALRSHRPKHIALCACIIITPKEEEEEEEEEEEDGDDE